MPPDIPFVDKTLIAGASSWRFIAPLLSIKHCFATPYINVDTRTQIFIVCTYVICTVYTYYKHLLNIIKQTNWQTGKRNLEAEVET